MSIEKENKGRYRLQSRDGWVGGSAYSLREKSTNFFFFLKKFLFFLRNQKAKKKKKQKLKIGYYFPAVSPPLRCLLRLTSAPRNREKWRERERGWNTHTHTGWDFLLILALISYNSQLKILDATHRGICCCSLFLYVFFLFLNHDALVLFGHLLYSFLIHIEVGPRFYTLNCSIDTSTWVVKFCQKKNKNTYGLFSSSDGGM